jgi:dTDP-4-amino-4,6-dideoxygalactose transaminase
VDVSLEDASIDVRKIKDAITQNTKAILVVHLFGISADMKSINNIAKSHDLLVFEDCAQAHHGKTNAGPVGNSSDGGAFSFYPTKNLGALGDAGAITLNDSAAADKIQSRRSYGVGSSKYEHIDTGWNTRLDSMHASILRTLLPGLESVTSFRQEIARSYLSSMNKPELVIGSSEIGENVYHHFVIRPNSRFALQNHMAQAGIMTDIHYPYFFNSIVPISKAYKAKGRVLPSLPNSELLSKQVVSLPMGPWMKLDQITHVQQTLGRFLNE